MDERERWEELYASGKRPDRPPSAWVAATLASLPNAGLAADIAGGSGRHAVLLAQRCRQVVLVDFVAGAVRRAMDRDSRILGVVGDASRLPLRPGRFDLVLVTNFLDRDAMPAILDLLAPGATLVYETYTLDHQRLVERGEARGPSSTRFLLQPGELRRLCSSLEEIRYEEGETVDAAGRRCTARLLARRPE